MNHRTFERKWHFQVPPGSMFPRVAPPSTSRCDLLWGSRRGPWPLPAGFIATRRHRLKDRAPPEAACSLDPLLRRLGWPTCYLDFASIKVVGLTRLTVVRRGVVGFFPIKSHGATPLNHTPPSSDARLPAELKHITKRRRRN